MKLKSTLSTKLVAIIAIIALLAIMLVGCNVIPTAQAASNNANMPKAVDATIKSFLKLDNAENPTIRQYNGTISELKSECEMCGIPTTIIGVQVPTIIENDGTIRYKYETVLFEEYAITVFEYVKLVPSTEAGKYIAEYHHGKIRLTPINGVLCLDVVDFDTNQRLSVPLKIYAE